MIDAHVHLWRIGRNGCTWPTSGLAPIHRDFTLEELRYAADSRVEGVVLVQSQEDAADTHWLLEQASDPLVCGVVGWAALDAPDAVAKIEALADDPRLRGIRPMVQGRAADWYDGPALDSGFQAMAGRGLVLDALVRPRHLASLARLAARHPGLAMVIDHAAKPVLADLAAWRTGMAALAAFPQVACKLSGLLGELAAESIAPVFDELWKCFGAERLMWGSDWPVLLLAGGYTEWLDLARGLVPGQHHDAVFGANARRIYGLDPAGERKHP